MTQNPLQVLSSPSGPTDRPAASGSTEELEMLLVALQSMATTCGNSIAILKAALADTIAWKECAQKFAAGATTRQAAARAGGAKLLRETRISEDVLAKTEASQRSVHRLFASANRAVEEILEAITAMEEFFAEMERQAGACPLPPVVKNAMYCARLAANESLETALEAWDAAWAADLASLTVQEQVASVCCLAKAAWRDLDAHSEPSKSVHLDALELGAPCIGGWKSLDLAVVCARYPKGELHLVTDVARASRHEVDCLAHGLDEIKVQLGSWEQLLVDQKAAICSVQTAMSKPKDVSGPKPGTERIP